MNTRKKFSNKLFLLPITIAILFIFINSVYIGNKQSLYIVKSYQEYLSQVSENPDMKLVHLSDSLKGLKLDIRYATENNFTKQKVYSSADPYLRLPAMRALRKVQDSLSKHNMGLIVFDAYRPYSENYPLMDIPLEKIKDKR